MDSATVTLWTHPFLLEVGFIEIPVFIANRVDPVQMPHSADLGGLNLRIQISFS